jgi:L-fuculokinase
MAAGGGSRNMLWNQIRADVLGRPVHITDQKENTSLGAAMFGFAGTNLFSNAGEARGAFKITGQTIEPGKNQPVYDDLYKSYCKIRHSLSASHKIRGKK